MQKVSTSVVRYITILLMGTLILSASLFLPQDAQAFSGSYSQPVGIHVIDSLQPGHDYGKPPTSPAIMVTVNGEPFTLNTYALAGSNLPRKPLPVEKEKGSATAPTPIKDKSVQKEAGSKASKETVTLAKGTKYATDLHIIKSGKPGPVVMIVGGVHGSEKAGYNAARKLVDYKISRGTLLVLPEANKRAISINRRLVKGEGDLNRSFPKTAKESPKNTLARAIYQVVKDYKVDWLMDMHEGYDYYKNQSTSSVGQTLIYYPANSARSAVDIIVTGLNKDISSSYKKFSLLRYPVKGSLARSVGQFLGVRSFIFETSMKPSLSTRVDYQLKAARYLLNELNML